jgi:hypothetical protein
MHAGLEYSWTTMGLGVGGFLLLYALIWIAISVYTRARRRGQRR